MLRTQTSPVQARVMEQGKLPIRMIAPGRVFRSDEVDATHSPSFHQIEGLVIDKNITFADLKGTLAEFARELFGPDTKTKFRPHHFPFTEPSAEVDVSCFKCGGTGRAPAVSVRGAAGLRSWAAEWFILMYWRCAALIRKNIPDFAFGVGLERIALLKYEIDDMRLLYENDYPFPEAVLIKCGVTAQNNQRESTGNGSITMNTTLSWIKAYVPESGCDGPGVYRRHDIDPEQK